MPLEEININRCLGVIGATDARDVAPERAYYAENLDITNRFGALVGLPEDQIYTMGAVDSEGDIAQAFGVDGDVCILDFGTSGNPDSTIKVQNYTSLTSPSEAVSQGSLTAVGNYQTISNESYSTRVGMGNGASGSSPAQFVGYVAHVQKNSGDSAAWRVEDAHLRADFVGIATNIQNSTGYGLKVVLPPVTLVRDNDSDANGCGRVGNHDMYTVDNTKANLPWGTYDYYVSFIYDHIQESPLSERLLRVDLWPWNMYVYDSNKPNGYYPWSASGTQTGDGGEEVTDYVINASGYDITGTQYEGIRVEYTLIDSTGTTTAYLPAGETAPDTFQFLSGQLGVNSWNGIGVCSELYVPFNKSLHPTYAYRYGLDGHKNVAKGIQQFEFDILLRRRTATSDMPYRVTGMKLYRRTARLSYDEQGKLQRDFTDYEFQHFFDLTSNTTETIATQAGAGVGVDWNDNTETYLAVRYVDDTPPDKLVTYYTEVGIEPEVSDHRVDYGLSTMLGGYNVVGRAATTELTGIQTYLFRSKPWRLDTFDWSTDYLMLEAEPVALKAFNGRVYAFCPNATYVIDATLPTMEIVETWTGVGAIHGNAIVATEKGMFWGDENTIYHHDGVRLWDIGSSVKHLHRVNASTGIPNYEASDVGWLQRYTGAVPCAVYVPQTSSFMLAYQIDNKLTDGPVYKTMAVMYHLETRSWIVVDGFANSTYPLEYLTTITDGIVIGSVGNGSDSDMYRIFGSVADGDASPTDPHRRPWLWASRNLHNGASKAKYYKARLHMISLPSDNDEGVLSYDNTTSNAMPTVQWAYSTDYNTLNTATDVDLDIDDSGQNAVAEYKLRGAEDSIYVRDFGIVISDADYSDGSEIHNNVVGHVAIIRRQVSAR